MSNTPRYAIYYSPEPGSILERFGAELLGYDAYQGVDLPFPSSTALPPDWRQLTQEPRKYGFHATLKAPMTLAAGRTETELLAACRDFAQTPRPIPTIRPLVDSIDGFIAIVPAEAIPALEGLAADCVRDFDSFRAPLTQEDHARRDPSKLTPRQRTYLDRWGYPYVLEEFRFHMTLTGRLEAEQRAPILDMLRNRFRDIGVTDLSIGGISLFRQDEPDRRFRAIGKWMLQSASL